MNWLVWWGCYLRRMRDANGWPCRYGIGRIQIKVEMGLKLFREQNSFVRGTSIVSVAKFWSGVLTFSDRLGSIWKIGPPRIEIFWIWVLGPEMTM